MQEKYDFTKVERLDDYYTAFMGDLPYEISNITREKNPLTLKKLLGSVIAKLKDVLSKIRSAAQNRPELEISLGNLSSRVEKDVAALEANIGNI